VEEYRRRTVERHIVLQDRAAVVPSQAHFAMRLSYKKPAWQRGPLGPPDPGYLHCRAWRRRKWDTSPLPLEVYFRIVYSSWNLTYS
jgi:hypothetical protein